MDGPSRYAWMNGELIPWDKAVLHVWTETCMRGWNVFEGIRAYHSADNSDMLIFRNDDHMNRLFNHSAKILRMKVDFTAEDITNGIIQLLRAEQFEQDVHLRPIIYFGIADDFDSYRVDIQTGYVITARQRPQSASLRTGINVCVSSWRRIDDTDMPPRVKAGSNYLNSRYITMEAKTNGYDSAIVLNKNGKVAEGPAQCVMIARGSKIITPPVTSGILESITRATLIELFQDELGIEVIERDIDRTELYVADEVFFCGTGAEVEPIVSVDRYPVGQGAPGPLVKKMQALYSQVVRGGNPKFSRWLTPVLAPAPVR